MDIRNPKAIIGTNSWGSSLYGKMVRGTSVDIETIKQSVETAISEDLLFFDLARDYGLGKAQPMLGDIGTKGLYISAKFTPFTKYKKGQVRKSLEKDLLDFKQSYVDVYWLHLPVDLEENLNEMIELFYEGKIHHIGISNFNLDECIAAKKILDKARIPLYGVQNHYSLINREWEKQGVISWCKENDILFWAWAVLEEGMLVDPKIKTKKSIMKIMFNQKKKKLAPLYQYMYEIGEKYHLTIPQVAIAYCCNKGIVPICGCRRPKQVIELSQACNITFQEDEIKRLEKISDALNIHILGADMFRFAVK